MNQHYVIITDLFVTWKKWNKYTRCNDEESKTFQKAEVADCVQQRSSNKEKGNLHAKLKDKAALSNTCTRKTDYNTDSVIHSFVYLLTDITASCSLRNPGTSRHVEKTDLKTSARAEIQSQ